ncbi:ribosome maturation protein [Papiliotrema laurentii]|uniref:Ribosome maturation protein n=1 Tax=Papiliotrema laurentii TaxID=5418 RepID=A0AAD9L796_PAPLA|nr:ribosome maturation protein [Papiliotrema laurentii]
MSTTQAVVYKASNNRIDHAEEYIVFVEDVKEYEQWKSDKSIALARFIGTFQIFKSSTSGHTGQLGAISKQEIETAFFADDKNVKDKSLEAAIQIILEHGKLQSADLSHSYKLTKNPAQGAGEVRSIGADRGSHR